MIKAINIKYPDNRAGVVGRGHFLCSLFNLKWQIT